MTQTSEKYPDISNEKQFSAVGIQTQRKIVSLVIYWHITTFWQYIELGLENSVSLNHHYLNVSLFREPS